MLQAARVDCWYGKSRPEKSLISALWSKRDRRPGASSFVGTGVGQTSYCIGNTVAFDPASLLITGASQDTHFSYGSFGYVMGSIFRGECPGTGGELSLAEPTMRNLISASGSYVIVQGSPRLEIRATHAEEKLTEAGKEIALIRYYFSLTTTDLSRILLVERPTVYAWLDGKSEPNRENRGRIRKLFNIAFRWREKSSLPIGKFLREPMEGELSLIDLLLRDTLETEAIDRVLVCVLEAVGRRAKTKRDRAVSAIVKRSGFKPLPPELERERFDQITRF
ncbi:MAG: hypothetical protein ABSD44_08995 [Terracidiphilus sp.]